MNHDLFSAETQTAFKSYGRPVVGWFCSYTPLEFFDAAGLTPARIAGDHGACGKADSLMHTNICPYIKSTLEAAENGKLDFLNAVVFTSGCDAQRRLYDYFVHNKKNIPAHLITVPKTIDHISVKMLFDEFVELREWLERTFSKKISSETLELSVESYKLLRARARGLDGARRKNPPTLSGSHALEIMLMIQRMPVAAAMALIDAEEEKIKHTPLPATGPRVIISGNILDDPEWLKKVESYGARVFADDLCTGRRFWHMPEADKDIDPTLALAEAYLSKPPCPRMAVPDDSIAELEKLVDNLKPDGLIFHVLKFCDTHMYNAPQLRNMLRDRGIKALFVESDYTTGAGQVETRIQAFIEMLKN